MSKISDDFNNPQKVREWYLGVHLIFEHIREKHNWTKKKTWYKLKIELINAVGPENLIADDLDWVKGILLDDIYPTTQEYLRVSQRYPNKMPLLDSLKKFI